MLDKHAENLNKTYDFIVNNSIATENEITLVTCINGYNQTSLNNIIYAKIGYHDMQQVLNCEPENYIK